MNIDPDKLKGDESVSNPMQVGLRYPDCPIGKICFHMVVGFGTVVEQCPHLKTDTDPAECTHDQMQSGA